MELGDQIRRKCIEMTTKAGSGHLTSSLSCADIMAVLFSKYLHMDPTFPDNLYNDRFILSKGHAAPALYATAALAGWLDENELSTLRQKDSRLEGHPTRLLPFVDVATGSLGQGLSNGIGMALGMRGLEPLPEVYVLMGDGEMAEGSVFEAMALATKLELTNITAIVDFNTLGQTGKTLYGDDAATLASRCQAFGWETTVINGHSEEELTKALERKTGRHFIIAKTLKGKGVPLIEGKEGWHAKVLSQEQANEALAGIPTSTARIQVARPEKTASVKRLVLPHITCPEFAVPTATKQAFGMAVADLVTQSTDIVVLDGDVGNSTMSLLARDAAPSSFTQTYIAEGSMVGIATGLDVMSKRAVVSTFAAFLSRAHDQLRMAALSKRGFVVNGSYAGVSTGRDGASQMGVEDIAMMRALPNSVVLYPSDAYASYKLTQSAIEMIDLVYVRTTRGPTPAIYTSRTQFPVGGSHLFSATDQDKVTIVSAGICVFEALKALGRLKTMGIPVRVIDLYSIKPIDVTTLRSSLHQTGGRLLVVEDHRPEGGIAEAVLDAVAESVQSFQHLAVNSIPHSASSEESLALQGIDAAAIVESVRHLL